MKFEDLNAWKEARALVNKVYSLTRKDSLAKDFGLRDQIQRAVARGRWQSLNGLKGHRIIAQGNALG